MAYTFDDNTVSDLHKDAHGFRPSRGFWDFWSTASDDEKQVTWDNLIAALDAEIAREKEITAARVAKFEELVSTTIAAGARDRATALRWIIGSYEGEAGGDLNYIEYLLGIPYGTFAKEMEAANA